ncbi:Aldo/keto reductase [Trametes cingulata]|nr:Aldo/keto reductase [Trametes cingulata]
MSANTTPHLWRRIAQHELLPQASTFNPAPPPPTKLGRHRMLSSLAGIHVSPLCLSGMSIGDVGQDQARRDEQGDELPGARRLLRRGSNLIDTANNYQNETSEMFIGEWMEQRGIRDQTVIATKYSSPYKLGKDNIKQQTSYVGNSLKSMHVSVRDSLKKLCTSYISILYIHWPP